MSTIIESAERDILSPLQRWLEAAIVVAMLLLFGFLAYHQWANTGFFTSKFGALEMVCLYSPLFLGMAAPLIRFWTGNRQPARPFEAADSLLLALGSLWAVIPAGLIAYLLVVRTALEDRTLRDELPGYTDYAQRVPYRLLPGIW